MNANFTNALTNDDWFILYSRDSYSVEPKDTRILILNYIKQLKSEVVFGQIT